MITGIYWRLGAEGMAGLPAAAAADAWLSASERARLAGFRVEKRRRDWLLGRLNGKALLVDVIAASTGVRLDPADVEIARHPSGAPFVQLAADARPVGTHGPGARLPIVVSNTHSAGRALFAAAWVAAAAVPTFTLGVDLEWVEPRSAGFIHDFLTPAERRYCEGAVDAQRDLRANLVWSAKESVLKALRVGLTADTYWLTCLPAAFVNEAGVALPDPDPILKGIDLRPSDAAWQPLAVGALDSRLGAEGLSFGGLWRASDGFVATLVVGR